MAFEIIPTNQTTSYTVQTDDEILLARGEVMTSVSDGFFGSGGTLSTTRFTILGDLVTAAVGFQLFNTTSSLENSHILIGASGSVIAGNLAFSLNMTESVSITNQGTIFSGDTAIVGAGTDTVTSIRNSGTISSGNSEAMFFVGGGGTIRVVNSGLIEGSGTSAAHAVGIKSRLDLNNSGEISGVGGFAIETGNVSFDDRIVNTGVINGEVSVLAGQDVVINSGAINGDVDLGTGDDSYDGKGDGFVTDAVLGGAGNDTLRGSNADDNLDGGTESDVLSGRGGDDTLMGDTGADTILGGDGNDLIDGEVNDDVVNGNAGDDTVTGSGGNDTLRGGRDDDEVRGGTGDDNMRGDSGADLLIGGDGRDDMFGGSGNDVFLFEDTNDSGMGAVRDRIYDFRSGEDTLDISQLVGGVISYIGSSNFSGTGGREVRAVNLSNGTLIYIDTNGDGARDSDIYLIGTDSVTEGDFLL